MTQMTFTKRGSILIGLMVSFVLGMLGLAHKAEAAPNSFTTGITVPDPSTSHPLGYTRSKAAGAKYTRVIIYWSHVAPKEEPENWSPADPDDPNYNWTAFDTQLINATAAGLTPMVQIYLAPPWAEHCEAPGEPGICNPDPAAFRQFTAAAVKRYSGQYPGIPKVRFWEPWNEPNLHIFFKPQRNGNQRPSPGLYRTLLNRFANVVKTQDPNNIVIGGGLAPLGGTASTHPLDFMRRLLCMQGRVKPKRKPGCNAAARFDIWATNPYTTGSPTKSAIHRDDVQMGDLSEVATLIKAAKRAGKIKSRFANIRLWVTEFSYDSAPPDPGGLKMSILNRWTAEAMFRSWKAGFDTFYWLAIRDWHRAEGLPFSQTYESGLWFRGETIEEDRPKAVLRVFRAPFVAIRNKRGITVWGRTLNSKQGNVVIRFGQRRNRVNRRIRVLKANRVGMFRAFIRTNVGRNKRGFMTATSRGFRSVPYSLKPQRNFYQPPFGKP